jgi:hypothetical protein
MSAGGAAKKVLRAVTGHKPGSLKITDKGKVGGPRHVTIHETGPSNRFMQPKKTTEYIHTRAPGSGPARKVSWVDQDRELRPGAKAGIMLGGTGAIIGTPFAGAAISDHRYNKKQKAKMKKSWSSVSAFGIDHGVS